MRSDSPLCLRPTCDHLDTDRPVADSTYSEPSAPTQSIPAAWLAGGSGQGTSSSAIGRLCRILVLAACNHATGKKSDRGQRGTVYWAPSCFALCPYADFAYASGGELSFIRRPPSLGIGLGMISIEMGRYPVLPPRVVASRLCNEGRMAWPRRFLRAPSVTEAQIEHTYGCNATRNGVQPEQTT